MLYQFHTQQWWKYDTTITKTLDAIRSEYDAIEESQKGKCQVFRDAIPRINRSCGFMKIVSETVLLPTFARLNQTRTSNTSCRDNKNAYFVVWTKLRHVLYYLVKYDSLETFSNLVYSLHGKPRLFPFFSANHEIFAER